MSPARLARRLLTLSAASLALPALVAVAAPARADTGGWSPKTPPLTTPWTDKVTTHPLPEYPRPQLTRPHWQNLNGVWQFAAATGADEPPPVGRDLAERILVPYPVESALSGIMRHEQRMWYRRTFTVPASWKVGAAADRLLLRRLLLHFGAVDYQAVIWVNGVQVATHQGGYDAFTVDVTAALRAHGPQELVVGVYDPTDSGDQPVGKQRNDPNGIFYTPTSGIWQTVWMEPTAAARVDRLDTTPDLATNTLRLTVQATGAGPDATVEAVASAGGHAVGRATGRPGEQIRVPVPHATLWSPDHPFLYDLTVRLVSGRRVDRTVDTVGSYFGMRSIGLATGRDGMLRPVLNGTFVFQVGTLDQGFWPDGIYTAPTDAALRSDLATEKGLGFNTVRKHIKVEPDRWYYWADKLGLLVWQDMPAMPTGRDPTPAARQVFESELRTMIDQHRSHPSIVMWVPFNEGWGEYDPARIAEEVKAYDPSRLVDNNSGYNCCGYDGGNGDVIDNHTYVGPGAPMPSATRAAVDGEFGGLGLRVTGHEWQPGQGFAYEMEPDAATLTARYRQLLAKVLRCEVRCGLAAAIYTQPTDVENEVNGLLTYDRRVLKVDPAAVRAANRAVRDAAATADLPDPPAGGPGTPGLTGIGAWSFDEDAGTTAHDSSGGGHDATLLGGVTWSAGHSGRALQFDGSTGQVDTGAPILDTTGDYSVAAWARLDSLGGFATAVSQDSDGASEFFLQYSGADNRWAFSTITTRALAPSPPRTGVWYHLVGVRDTAHNQLRLYVDGQLAGTAAYCPGNTAAGHTVIGRAQYGGNQVDFFRGAIDEVHVYDRALTPEEVAQLAAT